MERGASPTFEFGRFKVLPHRRELLADGKPIELGGRAFDVLMVLLEASGAVVGKDAIMDRVWPNRVVEENSLQAQVSLLRKALAADQGLIRTVAGRGYQFTGVLRSSDTPPVVPFPAPSRGPSNLPLPVSELIGRDAELDEIADLAAAHRLVTLCGTGGIGKTRLAIEAARRLLPGFSDGVWLVELAPLTDPALVPVAVAVALGIEVAGRNMSTEHFAAMLGRKQLLLVLDNCEQVVDAAAKMAETLLRVNPAVRIIATSRDPLRAEGERIFLVPPLEAPSEGGYGGEDPLQYGAVRLFVERAGSAEVRLPLEKRAMATVATICRRLDGIPLAIELAAARANALGIEGLASRLDDRFDLLTGGRRTALPRQQTLRATLDWSYDLLTEVERVVFRRLSVFAGSFTAEAAGVVALSPDLTQSLVIGCVANLVEKSLVVADVGGPQARHRLLETTRAYALEKFSECGERGDIARRHAVYYRDLFQRAAAESETRTTTEWLAAYEPEIDNVRAALDWAFSPGGDLPLGVALTVVSIPHWSQFTPMEEHRRRTERALDGMRRGPERDARLEMQLLAAHARSLRYLKDQPRQATGEWETVLGLAEGLGDTDYQLRALWGLWALALRDNDVTTSYARAEQFLGVAQNAANPADRLVGEEIMGVSQHYLGDQAAARRHFERVLEGYPNPAPASHTIRFFYAQRQIAQAFLARVMWVQGFSDQAMQMARAAAQSALSLNHTPTTCQVLTASACPIALLAGDLAAADYFLATLYDSSARHALEFWPAWAWCFEGMLAMVQNDFANGLEKLQRGVDALCEAELSPQFSIVFGGLAYALALAGRTDEALEILDGQIAQAMRTEERWGLAELLRLKGGVIFRVQAPGAAAQAEDCFRQGLDMARGQGALSWELRCATSLARLWRGRDRSAEARALLAPVYDRFTEGFMTADLRAAKQLIDELS
ncbi:MAG: winged helix-turn-helix domain-containing protein [Rhizomicrobium sp.]